MAKITPLLPGRVYHLYNRGTNRENIFLQTRNYYHFWNLYAKYIDSLADTFAFCLLRNHFHLLVRIKPSPESRLPARQFGHFFNAYAKAINHAYQRTGSLFEHPFRRIEVTSLPYFKRLIIYIHQNPAKHAFVQDFRDWPYSSYNSLISEKASRLPKGQILAWFAGLENLENDHNQTIFQKDLGHFSLEEDSID